MNYYNEDDNENYTEKHAVNTIKTSCITNDSETTKTYSVQNNPNYKNNMISSKQDTIVYNTNISKVNVKIVF